MRAVQDMNFSAFQSTAQYVYTLKSADYAKNTNSLNYLYLRSPLNGNLVPLNSVASFEKDEAGPLVINREGQLPAVNISFNLAEGVSLDAVLKQIEKIKKELKMPNEILRQPLGVCIVGGLLCSQFLTIFSTPVIYLYIDRLKHRMNKNFSTVLSHAKLR